MISRRAGLLVVGVWSALLLRTPALAASAADSSSAHAGQEVAIKAFLEEEVEFDRYLFPPGRFPSARWKRPGAVESSVGALPLTVDFYDSSFSRVSLAATPGRYGAVVRATTHDGFHVVRYVTLYCCTAFLDDYGPDAPVSMNSLPGFGIADARWKFYRDHLRRFSFGDLLTFPLHSPDAAIFLAGLEELNPHGGRMETPRLRDRQWWLEFKRRTDGRKHPALTFSPERTEHAAPVVREQEKAQLPPGRSDEPGGIHAICAEWTDSSGVPMVALVVHRGTVVFHEAFGRTPDGSLMSLKTPAWMASITKLFTGVLVMQFVDRGLTALDAPINRYLPELETGTPCPLTLRHLLTHTGGLSWTGEWASDWNPSLENQVAQALPFVRAGQEFKYHRSGYALAGKILERISGQTVPDLFERMILTPLGMDDSFVDNTYGGLYATASDLARFGQMLLNRGAYGTHRLLSHRGFNDLLPSPLRFGDRDLATTWGIGCAPFPGNGLSESTFGHSAASGAILRIDPVNDLVVVVARDRVGPNEKQHKRFVSRFLHAVGALSTTKGPRD